MRKQRHQPSQARLAQSAVGMQGASQLAGQPPAELLSNPLFDDPTLRLTPRLVLGVPHPAAPVTAPQPGSGRAGGAGASSASSAERHGLSKYISGKAAPIEPHADAPSAAHAPTQQAALGDPSCGGSHSCCDGAPADGQPDGNLAPAPPLLLTADADSASSLHSRAGSLAQGLPAGGLFSAASMPMTNAPDGHAGLTILYENQAMRMERVELKSELKLISARVGGVWQHTYGCCECDMLLSLQPNLNRLSQGGHVAYANALVYLQQALCTCDWSPVHSLWLTDMPSQD